MYNMYIYYIIHIYKARRLWSIINREKLTIAPKHSVTTFQLYCVVNYTFWQKCSEDNILISLIYYFLIEKRVSESFYYNFLGHFCKTNAGRHLSYILTNLVGKVSNHYVRSWCNEEQRWWWQLFIIITFCTLLTIVHINSKAICISIVRLYFEVNSARCLSSVLMGNYLLSIFW